MVTVDRTLSYFGPFNTVNEVIQQNANSQPVIVPIDQRNILLAYLLPIFTLNDQQIQPTNVTSSKAGIAINDTNLSDDTHPLLHLIGLKSQREVAAEVNYQQN